MRTSGSASRQIVNGIKGKLNVWPHGLAGSLAAEEMPSLGDTSNLLSDGRNLHTSYSSSGPSAGSGGTVADGIPGGAYWTQWTYSPLGDQATETDTPPA